MSQSKDIYNEKAIFQKIEDCCKHESQLNRWEQRFIASVGEMADKSMMLSPRQRTMLDRIWQKTTT